MKMIDVKKSSNNVCFNCKKVFDDGFEIDFDKKFFNNYKFCKNCAKSLMLGLNKNFVPKGVKSKSYECKVLD